MFFSDGVFVTQIIAADVEVGYLRGKVLCLDGDSRQEIRQCPVIGYIHPIFHLLGTLPAKQSRVTLTANSGKAAIVANPFKDQTGKFFF